MNDFVSWCMHLLVLFLFHDLTSLHPPSFRYFHLYTLLSYVNTLILQRATKRKKSAPLEIEKTDLEYGDLLGEGGGGAVYRGTWKSKGITVALKKVRLSPEHCDAKILAKLGEHPNIISFFGFVHEYPDTTVIIALAKNGSLYQCLHKDQKDITFDQGLKWARQIAYGMAHLHNLGIAHRDLKSSNNLFTDDMEVQICDFGLSRSIPNTTAISKTAGTWRWMAPEIAKDQHYV